MPVESPADLAGMFSEAEFAERASYAGPGGGGSTPCVVIVDRGQARKPLRTGEGEAVTSERKLWAQQSELAEVKRDGVFTMLDPDGAPTGEAFKVSGMPTLDRQAALWSAKLLIVS